MCRSESFLQEDTRILRLAPPDPLDRSKEHRWTGQSRSGDRGDRGEEGYVS